MDVAQALGGIPDVIKDKQGVLARCSLNSACNNSAYIPRMETL